MKKLYSFTVSKEETINQETETTAEDGSVTKVTRPVKTEVPYSFFICDPTRSMRDDANLFYGVKMAEGVRAGLLTIPLLQKRNTNDGGVFSEKDKQSYVQLLETYYQTKMEFQKLDLVKEMERTDEQKTKHKELFAVIADLNTKLSEYDNFNSSIYEHTAEMRAKNFTVTWWLLNMAYQIKDGKNVPFFGSGDYNQKLNEYDKVTEVEDSFTKKLILKFITYTSLWYNNGITKAEDFEKFERIIMQEPAGNTVKVEEEKKE